MTHGAVEPKIEIKRRNQPLKDASRTDRIKMCPSEGKRKKSSKKRKSKVRREQEGERSSKVIQNEPTSSTSSIHIGNLFGGTL